MLNFWTEYKWLIIGIAFTLFVSLSFGSGYKVKGWRDDSSALKQSQAAVSNLNKGFQAVVTAADAETDAINKLNQQTETAQSVLTQQLGDQNNAFMQIQLGLKGANVGGCTLTPDADSLYTRAYQAAFGTAGPQVSAKGKAGAGHAGPPATHATHAAQPATSH